jgi:hypothetical protein
MSYGQVLANGRTTQRRNRKPKVEVNNTHTHNEKKSYFMQYLFAV